MTSAEAMDKIGCGQSTFYKMLKRLQISTSRDYSEEVVNKIIEARKQLRAFDASPKYRVVLGNGRVVEAGLSQNKARTVVRMYRREGAAAVAISCDGKNRRFFN